MVTGRNASAGDEVVRHIESTGGKAVFHAADVSNPEDLEALVNATVAIGGGLHGLVVNAASVEVGNGDGPVTEIDVDDWNRMIAANLTSVFLSAKFGLRAMVEGGGGGSVVLIGSLAGARGIMGMDAYTTIKGGMAALNRSIATYYSRYRIRCNCLSLGFVNSGTERAQSAMKIPGYAENNAAWQLGRIVRPEEVATVAAHLLSDEASFMNGAEIPLDGGAAAASHKPQVIQDLPWQSSEQFAYPDAAH